MIANMGGIMKRVFLVALAFSTSASAGTTDVAVAFGRSLVKVGDDYGHVRRVAGEPTYKREGNSQWVYYWGGYNKRAVVLKFDRTGRVNSTVQCAGLDADSCN